MRKLKLSELILDFDLYPRASINTYHAGEMQRAVEAGAELPPIVIDKKSKRIVDGFHRHRVYSRTLGEEGEVEVVEKTYRSEHDIFLDAMRLNASHGLRMDSHDKAHCVLRCINLKIDDAEIASVLHVDPSWIGELRNGRTATNSGGLSVALKRTIRHKAGMRLTKRQEEANEKLSGMNQSFYANQLIHLMESKLLDTSDEELMARLQVLSELLDGVLAAAK